jgi:hypothetical protein
MALVAAVEAVTAWRARADPGEMAVLLLTTPVTWQDVGLMENWVETYARRKILVVTVNFQRSIPRAASKQIRGIPARM